jgi:hypothetical protein
MSRKYLLVMAIAAVAIVVIGVATLSCKPDTPSAPTDDGASRGSSARAPESLAPARSAPSALASRPDAAAPIRATAPAPATAQSDSVGTVQGVPSALNLQVASVASALQQHDHPERLSALVQPPVFDAAAYAANPARYANDVVPGRALQSAAPGPNVPVLLPLVPTQATISQDQTTILRVKSQPGSAVTFTSFDLGHFGNALASQTVTTDANGVGSVSFTAGPGTIDAVHVLAGSPGASGQVLFDLMITPASPAASSRTGI